MERDREAWRQAAGALEAYRQRWGLADDPAALCLGGPSRAREPSTAVEPLRRAEERRVLAACRAVGRARSLALEADRGAELGR